MRGRESLFIGFTRPDLFGYVAAITTAPGKDWAMIHQGQIKEEELKIREEDAIPYLIMLCCGTKDGQFVEA